MTGANLKVDRVGGTLTITFDQPRIRNALNRATRIELVSRLRAADADPSVRAIVLTGTDPAFTSGVDFKEFLGNPDYVPPPVDPPAVLRGMATPTIAAVNGACVSGGLEIVLACSMIVASEHARFADTHARLGITPGWGLSADLPAAVGYGRARQLSLTAQPIDAATALLWGLVNEVMPHERLLARSAEIAEAIAAIAEPSIRGALGLYQRGQDAQLARLRALESETD